MKPYRVAFMILLGAAVLAWLANMLAPGDAAASMAYWLGQSDDAARLYTEASVRQPDDLLRMYSAGSAQIGVDDADAAALLGRVHNGADESLKIRALYNAGIAYFRQGDYFAAARSFREVLTIDHDDADARYNYEMSLRYALPPTPSEQQQQTNPEDGFTDATITPSPEPGGFDGPTPTPPREEFEPDPTQTPVGGSGDFGDNADSTPVPVDNGELTIEQAMQLLDAAAQDTLIIAPFYATPVPGHEIGGNDW